MGCFPFTGPTPLGALLTLAVRCHLVAYVMITPRGRWPTPTTRAPAFIGRDGPFGIRLTGKLEALDLGGMAGEGLGFLELLIRMGLGMTLVGTVLVLVTVALGG